MKPKFNWEFNFGHILILLGFAGAVAVNSIAVGVRVLKMEASIQQHSDIIQRHDSTLAKIADAQVTTSLTLTRIQAILDEQARRQEASRRAQQYVSPKNP